MLVSYCSISCVISATILILSLAQSYFRSFPISKHDDVQDFYQLPVLVMLMLVIPMESDGPAIAGYAQTSHIPSPIRLLAWPVANLPMLLLMMAMMMTIVTKPQGDPLLPHSGSSCCGHMQYLIPSCDVTDSRITAVPPVQSWGVPATAPL